MSNYTQAVEQAIKEARILADRGQYETALGVLVSVLRDSVVAAHEPVVAVANNSADEEGKSCSACGASGLRWWKTILDRWRLVDSFGEVHECDAYKEAKLKNYNPKTQATSVSPFESE
jgi:hypothetical protein